MNARVEEPRVLYPLLLVTLVADFMFVSWVFWHAVHRPATDFALARIQFRVLLGSLLFAGLPVVTFFFLLYEQPASSFFYAILKFYGALKLAAQLYGTILIGKSVSWIAYAQVGWAFFAAVLAAAYFFAKFRFGPTTPSITSSIMTLVEKIAALNKLKAEGTLSEEQFEKLRAKLVVQAENDDSMR
jgi:L-lactate permease